MSTNSKCYRECSVKGTMLQYGKKCKLVQSLWKTVWRFLKKLKIELPYDTAMPLLGIYPVKTITQKDISTHMFITAQFTIAKTWKQSKCLLTDEWIKKNWTLLSRKKGFPCGSAGKESSCNAGDLGSNPGLRRSPGKGKGYLLQYSGLENSMDMRLQRVGHDWVTFTSQP